MRNTVERTTGASVPMDLFVDGSSLDRVIDIVFTQVERHLIAPHTSATDTQMEISTYEYRAAHDRSCRRRSHAVP
ncbi:hypothetical protein [Pseudomonas chlororaphis]|uniref:hypothetical protein n=1 Tax=Pseudomonas chlororaphis TaxID=587753 RepID=UPI0039E17B50